MRRFIALLTALSCGVAGTNLTRSFQYLAPASPFDAATAAGKILGDVQSFYAEGYRIYFPLLEKLFSTSLPDGEIPLLAVTVGKDEAAEIERRRKSVKNFQKNIARVQDYCRAVLKGADRARLILTPQEGEFAGGLDHVQNGVRLLSLLHSCLDAYKTFQRLNKKEWAANEENFREQMAAVVFQMQQLALSLATVFEEEFGNKKTAFGYLGYVMNTFGTKDPLDLDGVKDADFILRLIPLLNDMLLPATVIALVEKLNPGYFRGGSQTPEKTLAALFETEEALARRISEDRIPSLVQSYVYALIFKKEFEAAREHIRAGNLGPFTPRQKSKLAFPTGILLLQEGENLLLKTGDRDAFRAKLEAAARHFAAIPENGWGFDSSVRVTLQAYCLNRLGEFDPSLYARARDLLAPYARPSAAEGETEVHRDPLLYASYALASWHSGDRAAAVEALKQMMFLNPFSPDAHFKLFDALCEMGRKDDAFDAFARGYALSGEDDQHFSLFFHFSDATRNTGVQILGRLLGDPRLGPSAEKGLAQQLFRFAWYGVHERQGRLMLEPIAAEGAPYSPEARQRAARLLREGAKYWAPAEPQPAAPAAREDADAATPENSERKPAWLHLAAGMTVETMLTAFAERPRPRSKKREPGSVKSRRPDTINVRHLPPNDRRKVYMQIVLRAFFEEGNGVAAHSKIFDYSQRILDENLLPYAMETPARPDNLDPRDARFYDLGQAMNNGTNQATFWMIFLKSVWRWIEQKNPDGSVSGLGDKAAYASDAFARFAAENPNELGEGIDSALVWRDHGAILFWRAQRAVTAEERARLLALAKTAQEKCWRLCVSSRAAYETLKTAGQELACLSDRRRSFIATPSTVDEFDSLERNALLLRLWIAGLEGNVAERNDAAGKIIEKTAGNDPFSVLVRALVRQALGEHEKAAEEIVAFLDRSHRANRHFVEPYDLIETMARNFLAAGKIPQAVASFFRCHLLNPENAEPPYRLLDILAELADKPEAGAPFLSALEDAMTYPAGEFLDLSMKQVVEARSRSRDLFVQAAEKILDASDHCYEAFSLAIVAADEDADGIFADLGRISIPAVPPADKKLRGQKGNAARAAHAAYLKKAERLETWKAKARQREQALRLREWEKKAARLRALETELASSLAPRIPRYAELWPNVAADIPSLIKSACRDEARTRLRNTEETGIPFEDRIVSAISRASADAYLAPFGAPLTAQFGADRLDAGLRELRAGLDAANLFSPRLEDKMTLLRLRRELMPQLVCHISLERISGFVAEEELLSPEDLVEVLETADGGEPKLENLKGKVEAFLVHRFRTFFPFYAEGLQNAEILSVLLDPGKSAEAAAARFSERRRLRVFEFSPQDFGDIGFHLVIDLNAAPAASAARLYFPAARPAAQTASSRNETHALQEIAQEDIQRMVWKREDELLRLLKENGVSADAAAIATGFGEIPFLENMPQWRDFWVRRGAALEATLQTRLKPLVAEALQPPYRARCRQKDTYFYFSFIPLPDGKNFFAVKQTSGKPFLDAAAGPLTQMILFLFDLPDGYARYRFERFLAEREAHSLLIARVDGADTLVFGDSKGARHSFNLPGIVQNGSFAKALQPFTYPQGPVAEVSFLLGNGTNGTRSLNSARHPLYLPAFDFSALNGNHSRTADVSL